MGGWRVRIDRGAGVPVRERARGPQRVLAEVPDEGKGAAPRASVRARTARRGGSGRLGRETAGRDPRSAATSASATRRGAVPSGRGRRGSGETAGAFVGRVRVGRVAASEPTPRRARGRVPKRRWDVGERREPSAAAGGGQWRPEGEHRGRVPEIRFGLDSGVRRVGREGGMAAEESRRRGRVDGKSHSGGSVERTRRRRRVARREGGMASPSGLGRMGRLASPEPAAAVAVRREPRSFAAVATRA